MTALHQPSANTPFLQGIPSSLISKEWYRYLAQNTQILGGGGNVVPIDDSQILEAIDQSSNSGTQQNAGQISDSQVQAAMSLDATSQIKTHQLQIDDSSLLTAMQIDQTAMVKSLQSQIDDANATIAMLNDQSAAINKLTQDLQDALLQIAMSLAIPPASLRNPTYVATLVVPVQTGTLTVTLPNGHTFTFGGNYS